MPADAGRVKRGRLSPEAARALRLLDGEARHSMLSDRAVVPPFGVAGADPAALGVSPGDGVAVRPLATPRIPGGLASSGPERI